MLFEAFKIRHKPTGLFSSQGYHNIVPQPHSNAWNKIGKCWPKRGSCLLHLRMILEYGLKTNDCKSSEDYFKRRKETLSDIQILQVVVDSDGSCNLNIFKADDILPKTESDYEWGWSE